MLCVKFGSWVSHEWAILPTVAGSPRTPCPPPLCGSAILLWVSSLLWPCHTHHTNLGKRNKKSFGSFWKMDFRNRHRKTTFICDGISWREYRTETYKCEWSRSICDLCFFYIASI